MWNLIYTTHQEDLIYPSIGDIYTNREDPIYPSIGTDACCVITKMMPTKSTYKPQGRHFWDLR